MTSTRDYRAESRAARQAARETLLAFRKARQGKSGATREAANQRAISGLSTSSLAPETLFDMSQSIPAGPDEAVCDQDPTNPPDLLPDTADGDASVGCLTESDAAVRSSVTALAEDALERGSPQEVVTNQAEIPEADIAYDVSDGHREPGAPEALASLSSQETAARICADSDLLTLPGAGAGMVWMFNQCGIYSLSELAASDPKELSMKLGVVGRILNIEPWIHFASDAARQRSV